MAGRALTWRLNTVIVHMAVLCIIIILVKQPKHASMLEHGKPYSPGHDYLRGVNSFVYRIKKVTSQSFHTPLYYQPPIHLLSQCTSVHIHLCICDFVRLWEVIIDCSFNSVIDYSYVECYAN